MNIKNSSDICFWDRDGVCVLYLCSFFFSFLHENMCIQRINHMTSCSHLFALLGNVNSQYSINMSLFQLEHINRIKTMYLKYTFLQNKNKTHTFLCVFLTCFLIVTLCVVIFLFVFFFLASRLFHFLHHSLSYRFVFYFRFSRNFVSHVLCFS